MKNLSWMIAVVALVGCGKKEPAQPSASNSTNPSEFEATKAAAEAGDAIAQYNLGGMYRRGQGVEQDLKKSFKWCQKAADQGHAIAQNSLGVMYENGEGVDQDFKEAFNWYQKAADQGDAEAQYNLGTMYYKGQGVDQNDVIAYAWCNVASTNGDQNVKKVLSIVAKEMTPAQIAKAEELVKEMVKKNPKLLNK